MTDRARIAAVATAVPEHVLEQSEVIARAREIFAPDVPGFERYTDAYRNAAIDTRHSCVPIDWYGSEHPFSERNDLYIENAVALLARVCEDLFRQSGLAASEIDALVVVSTTGVATPSLDALLLERLPFRRDVQRLPIFGLGCAGGVSGLARAAQIAMSRPDARVLYLVVELCGLTSRVNDTSKSNIIATAQPARYWGVDCKARRSPTGANIPGRSPWMSWDGRLPTTGSASCSLAISPTWYVRGCATRRRGSLRTMD